MMENRRPVQVNESHRRAMGTTLGLLDRVLCEFEELARGRERRSVLYEERNELSASQRESLLEAMGRMRAVIEELAGALDLQGETECAAKTIWAEACGLWEVLVETTSRHLMRYGPVPQEAAAYIDARIEELVRLVSDIAEVAGKGDRGGGGETP